MCVHVCIISTKSNWHIFLIFSFVFYTVINCILNFYKWVLFLICVKHLECQIFTDFGAYMYMYGTVQKYNTIIGYFLFFWYIYPLISVISGNYTYIRSQQRQIFVCYFYFILLTMAFSTLWNYIHGHVCMLKCCQLQCSQRIGSKTMIDHQNYFFSAHLQSLFAYQRKRGFSAPRAPALPSNTPSIKACIRW